jgi:hypothetical protein
MRVGSISVLEEKEEDEKKENDEANGGEEGAMVGLSRSKVL